MRCKTCQYSLWNLREHRCPECGTAFQVRDHEFMPSSVRYCCPHCMQDYYGLSEKGHLVPDTFTCVKCGQFINMEQMVLLPAEGLKEEHTRAVSFPWRERHTRGKFSAWFGTIGWGLGRPSDIGRLLDPVPRAGESLIFCLVTMSIVTALAAAAPLVMCGVFAGGLGGGNFGDILLALLMVGLFIVGLWAAVNGCALLAHAILWATGECEQTLGGTVEVMNYTTGPFALSAIPCLGFYALAISWVWWSIGSILALMNRQHVSACRACFAVLVPTLLAPTLLIGLWIGAIFISTSSISSSYTLPSATMQPQIGSMDSALKGFVQAHPGEPLKHPLQLVAEQGLNAQDFLPDWTLTADRVPVGDSTLDDFVFWARSNSTSPEEIRAAVQAEIDAIPEDAAAVRLGEYVFPIYEDSILPPGYGQAELPSRLWIAVICSAPKAGSGLSFGYNAATVLKVDGSLEVFQDGESFDDALTAQNQLRTDEGFAPLPDPRKVKHARP